VAPVLTYFAVNHELGFAIPMLIGTMCGLISMIVALLLSPETKGHVFTSDLVVVP
jgi:MFS transporter, SHS family, lactate transporter